MCLTPFKITVFKSSSQIRIYTTLWTKVTNSDTSHFKAEIYVL
jgi:hypothetical protein